MNITFDAQPLCSHSKTGIGWYTYNIMKTLIHSNPEFKYTANFFDFLSRNSSEVLLKELLGEKPNLSYNCFSLLPYGVYLRSQSIFKYIPYEKLLKSSSNITHFFNFLIPINIKSKTVLTVYDMVYKLYPETMSKSNYNLLDKGLERSCKQADKILTISKNSKAEISKFMKVPESKIEIAYPAVDTSLYKLELVKDDRILRKYGVLGEYILYLGTLEPRKNLITLIKAFESVSQKYQEVKLVIAGGKGWGYNSLFRMLEELKIGDKVIFTGYIDEMDKPCLYNSAIAFVFPSLYEGFGMPPLEAMACGVPVIASNASSLPEVVGDAGILVNPMDIEELANSIFHILGDSKLRTELSQKGITQAKKFIWQESAEKVLNIYEGLL